MGTVEEKLQENPVDPGGGGSSQPGAPPPAVPGGGTGTPAPTGTPTGVVSGGFTGPDAEDGHVHAVVSFNSQTGNGVTDPFGGPGTSIPAHAHAIIAFRVEPYQRGSYISQHKNVGELSAPIPDRHELREQVRTLEAAWNLEMDINADLEKQIADLEDKLKGASSAKDSS